MAADVEVLPCPCGAAAAIHNTGVSDGPREKLVVACVDPECHWSMTGYGTEQVATRWNRQSTAARDAEIARLNEAFDSRERMLADIEQAHAVEIEALRAEVDEWKAIATWEKEQHDRLFKEARALNERAEHLAEALREAKRLGDQGDWRAERAVICAALHPTAAQENDDA